MKFLRRRGNRELFQGVCLVEGPSVWLRRLFDNFSGNLSEWRWGYIVNTLRDLMDLETPLRNCWNTKALEDGHTAKHRRGDDQEEEEGYGVAAVYGAAVFVESPAHWQYGRMILTVADLLVRLQSWVESCPCHGLPPLAENVPRRKRHRAFLDQMISGVKCACPMKGRRAPEMACGDFIQVMEQWWGEMHCDIIFETGALPAQDQTRIIADMEQASDKFLQASGGYYVRIPRVSPG